MLQNRAVWAVRMRFAVFDLRIRAHSASKSYRIMGRSALVAVWHPHSKVVHHKIPSGPQVCLCVLLFLSKCKNRENMTVKSSKEEGK